MPRWVIYPFVYWIPALALVEAGITLSGGGDMSQLMFLGGIALLICIGLFALAIMLRRGAAAEVEVKTKTATVDSLKRQNEAAAKAPKTVDRTADALDKGEF